MNSTCDKVSELGVCGKAASQGQRRPRGLVNNAGHHAKVMQWDSGDLSLIKGVMVQREAARGLRYSTFNILRSSSIGGCLHFKCL